MSESEVQSETFKRELLRIRFRQSLMSVSGGVAWMVHIGKLFGFVERVFGPGEFGMPTKLRVAMHRLGW